MNASIEEVIKEIINIDKSAAIQREILEKEISKKRKEAEENIKKFRFEIVESQEEKAKAMKYQEISRTSIEAEKVKENAYKKCDDMYKTFKQHKDTIIEEVFREIFND